MEKEDLIKTCMEKDVLLDTCIKRLKENGQKMLCKKDIMNMYGCENDKALKILKLMFSMGYGNKIGKEYYTSKQAHEDFIRTMAGREVFIQCLAIF